MLRTNRSLWVSAALEVGSALNKRTSNINMKASQQSQAPKRPDALAPQVPGKGPALGPAAVTPSPASKSYPPVQGPVTRSGNQGWEGQRQHHDPPAGRREGAGSLLRASLTSVEPGSLQAASGGPRGPWDGGWGRAPARRTTAAPCGAPGPSKRRPGNCRTATQLSRQPRGRARPFRRN